MTIGWRGKSSLALFALAAMARRGVILPSDEISAGTVPGPLLDLGAEGTISGRIATFAIIDDPDLEANKYWPSTDPKRFRLLEEESHRFEAMRPSLQKTMMMDEPRPERGKVRKGKKQRLRGLRP